MITGGNNLSLKSYFELRTLNTVIRVRTLTVQLHLIIVFVVDYYDTPKIDLK